MARKARHSPGPWKVYNKRLRPQFPGRIIEVQTFYGEALVAWGGFDAVDQPKGVRLANAKLMAASPVLLAAVRHARGVLAHVDGEENVCRELDAAIAAAT